MWWYHPKHIEQFPDKINCVTLHLVGHILEYCKFASGFCALRPVPNITMTLHSYLPVILVGGSSIRKHYLMVVNYLQSVPGTRVTECYITMSPTTGVVLNFQVGTGRCICRACSSSVCVKVQGWKVCKNESPWCKVPVEKLTVSQRRNILPTFYGTRKCIAVFKTARHLSLP